jgi:hypothetical protein
MIGYLALNAPWRWGLHRDVDGNLEPDEKPTVSPHTLHGYPHPTVFKTVRNAMRAAGPGGYVLVLDLYRLPLVHLNALPPDDLAAVEKSLKKQFRHKNGRWDHEQRRWINDETPDEQIELPPAPEFLDVEIGHDDADDIYIQHQLAERQALIWTARLEQLTALIKRQGPG